MRIIISFLFLFIWLVSDTYGEYNLGSPSKHLSKRTPGPKPLRPPKSPKPPRPPPRAATPGPSAQRQPSQSRINSQTAGQGENRARGRTLERTPTGNLERAQSQSRAVQRGRGEERGRSRVRSQSRVRQGDVDDRSRVRSQSRGRPADADERSRSRHRNQSRLRDGGTTQTELAERYGLPRDQYGRQTAGPYTIQPGERSRSRYRHSRQQASESDASRLARHLPDGIPRNGDDLARTRYPSRSRSRPRPRPDQSRARSERDFPRSGSRQRQGSLLVEHTDWREQHPDNHANGGWHRTANIYTPGRQATDAEMSQILRHHAPAEQEAWEKAWKKMGPGNQRKHSLKSNRKTPKSQVLGLQTYDKYGSMSTTVKGKEQGPAQRKADDKRWLDGCGPGMVHTSGGRCTEHGNYYQLYPQLGLNGLPPQQRLETLRTSGIRTATVDARTLESLPGCEDSVRSDGRVTKGCNKRNKHYNAQDVASSSRSGRQEDILHRQITDEQYQAYVDRQETPLPPPRPPTPFQDADYEYDENPNSKGKGKAKRKDKGKDKDY